MLITRLQIRHLYPVIPLIWLAIVPIAPLMDNSFLWHVRAGAVQLGSSRVITSDPFSFTAAEESWRTQSWIAELLYAQLESLTGGIDWTPILVAVVMVAALSMTGLSIYANSRSVLITAAWLIVAVWLLAAFSQPRPVMFSFLLLAALVVVLTMGDCLWWAIVPIIWLWAGLHGTWIIGIGLVSLEAFRQRSPRLGAVAGVAFIATGLTAHGLGAWGFLLSFAESSDALTYLQEWQPPDLGDLVQMPFLLVIGGLFVASTRGKYDISALWIILPFLAFGLTSRRTVPVAALVLIPLAARAVVYRLPKSEVHWTPVPIVVLVLAATIVVGLFARSDVELAAERFPSDGAIEAVGDARSFHDLGVGGYLIYRSGPEDLVYIDDRAELYGEERFAEFESARMGDYEELFARLDLEAAIVKPNWPLHRILLRDGWIAEYEDEAFVTMVSPHY